MNQRIILASESPRRKELLTLLGFPFDVMPSPYEEDMTLDMNPYDLVQTLALGKAEAVENMLEEPAIIIGADTFIVHNNRPIGKPKDAAEAQAMLRELTGTTHEVVTGMACINMYAGERTVVEERSSITMRSMTDTMIQNYIATGEPMDKAGAYAVQGLGAILIENLVGDFFTVVGLPVCRLSMILEDWGILPFSSSTS